MNNILTQMLSKYDIKNTNDEINALKEIIQEIVLSGLSRGGFFKKVALCGDNDLSKYFIYIEKELKAYGLNLEISSKQKNIDSNITSAFLKGDTLEHILKFFPNGAEHKYNSLLKNIKIKFEVDINPTSGATYIRTI